MNEKLNAVRSNNGTSERGCERAEELVTCLYGEATPEQTKVFRAHMTGCAICRDEWATFGGVRELVGEWRAEALGAIPSLGMDEPFANAAALRPAYARRRSAMAALREFFSLSPLWLQAGAVAATLVLFALAALTLARAEVRWDSNGLAFRTLAPERITVKEPAVQTTEQVGFTQEQVNSIVADARAKWDGEKNKEIEVMQAAWKRQSDSQQRGSGAATIAHQSNVKRFAPGGSSQRSLQVANNPDENVFYPNEEQVPRLTDILGAVKPPKANER